MNQDVNQSHQHQKQHPHQQNVTVRNNGNNSPQMNELTHLQNQPNSTNGTQMGQKDTQQNIIASVERPSLLSNQSPTTTTTNHKTSIPMKQSSNSKTNSQLQLQEQGINNQKSAAPNSKNAVIISQLQQLQSPPPQPTATRESPIIQVTKSRHRGFLSQLLCCFRPSSSNIYQDSTSIYNNTEPTQQPNSLTTKYGDRYLLPARKPSDNRICLVIDLDETLVHSSFKPIENADFIVPVEIDGTLHKVYVLKRPHVDEFLKRMGQIYECVLFTASLAKYADPVADLLDKDNIFKARLFRESCAFYRGNYVKDLGRLGRDLNRVIIVDNSPASYIFHPDNAVSIPRKTKQNNLQQNVSSTETLTSFSIPLT